MARSDESIELPMPAWAKRHGYITWNKMHDDAIRDFLGNRTSVELSVKGTRSKVRIVEFNQRRIGIGYAITKSLADAINTVTLHRTAEGIIKVDFI